jgi:hypothetical protein
LLCPDKDVFLKLILHLFKSLVHFEDGDFFSYYLPKLINFMKNFQKGFLPILVFAIIAFGGCFHVKAGGGCPPGGCGVTYNIINNLNCDFGFEWMSACHSLTGVTFTVPANTTSPGAPEPVPCLTGIPDCPDGCAAGFYIVGGTAIIPPAGSQEWDIPQANLCGCPTGVRVTWTPSTGGSGTFVIDCY